MASQQHSDEFITQLTSCQSGLFAYILSLLPDVEAAQDVLQDANLGGDTLACRQRFVLQRGPAEITFNSQAKVIVEGPADFVITDAATCRLDVGKLAAHVPESGRGFKVHTPDSTVTDLGTDFGVYVKSEVRSEKAEVEEQKEGGKQQAVELLPATEVHVFKGQVELTQTPEGDSPTVAPQANNTAAQQKLGQSPSKIENPFCWRGGDHQPAESPAAARRRSV